MRAQSDSQLISFHEWTLRVRPATLRPARLLLLIHGLTGDENSMWVFVRSFRPDYWIIAPRAPHGVEPTGYSWRLADSGPHRPPGLADLRASAQALIALVDEYAAENDLDAREVDTIGFSQGAALTNTLALLYPERIPRAGVLAGFVPAGAESLVEKRPLEGKAFFVAHGTLDEQVSVADARRSVELLKEAGARITFCEGDVGHKISAGCLRELERFFA